MGMSDVMFWSVAVGVVGSGALVAARWGMSLIWPSRRDIEIVSANLDRPYTQP